MNLIFRLIFSLALVSLVSCGGDTADTADTGSGEKVLHYGNGGEPKTVDPNLQSLVLEGNIMYALFEGLVSPDAAGNTIPGQAESWNVSEDGLKYVFILRRGLIWSDGHPLTAEDFAYSLRRIVDPETAAELAFSAYAIKNAEAVNTGELPLSALGVKAVDDHTLEITLGKPQPALIATLRSVQGLPVPKHVIEKHGKEWIKPENIATNGAYLYKSWEVGNRLEIEKSPHYWAADSVAIDRVFFYPTEDSEAALRRVRAGELHIDRNFPMARAEWLRNNMPKYMRTHPYLGSYFYVFNTKKPPLNDVRVRQALNMLVDRDLIVRLILNDLGYERAYSMVPPTMSDWEAPEPPEWVAWTAEERHERAGQLLAEAGYGLDNPLSVNLSYNTDEGHKRIAIAISKMWQAIGVNATLENFEFRVHTDNVNQGNFEIARRGWIGIEGMPEFFLGMFETNTLPLNSGRWSSQRYDETLALALEALTVHERHALFREADAILQQELPLLPIYFYISRNLVSPNVTGWVDNPVDGHHIRFLDIVGD